MIGSVPTPVTAVGKCRLGHQGACDHSQVSDSVPPKPEDAVNEPAKVQFEAFLDQHRAALNDCLNGLSEEQVRRSLV